MRHDLAEDPAVIGIAQSLGLSTDTVVGKLHRLWSWADRQTADGFVRNVSHQWVDEFANQAGFACAIEHEKWLIFVSENGVQGVQFPHFERHNGESAKRRAAETQRKARQRSVPQNVRKMSQDHADKKRDQRREEKRRSNTTSSLREDVPRKRGAARPDTWLTPFGGAWSEATGGRFQYGKAAGDLDPLVKEHGAEKTLKAWAAYLAETPADKASTSRFAATFGVWSGDVSRGRRPEAAEEPFTLRINEQCERCLVIFWVDEGHECSKAVA